MRNLSEHFFFGHLSYQVRLIRTLRIIFAFLFFFWGGVVTFSFLVSFSIIRMEREIYVKGENHKVFFRTYLCSLELLFKHFLRNIIQTLMNMFV